MEIESIVALIFIFIRVSAFFIVVPIFFPSSSSNILKAMFALILSFALMPAVSGADILNINSDIGLILNILNEVISGIVLGFAVSIWFHFISMAGSFVDLQMGLSMLSMYDPNTKTNSTLLSNVTHWVAIIIFFIIDGHHMLIRMLRESFEIIPLGGNILSQQSTGIIIEAIISYFILALRISIPLVMIIIVSDLVMGLISRSVPQLNVMVLGMPIKIVVGIISFLISLPIIIDVIVSGINLIPDLIKSIFTTIPIIFIFSEEKTEEATPKKKADSRKKGQIPKSKEVSTALTLGAILLVITAFGSFIVTSFKKLLIHYFSYDFGKALSEFDINNNFLLGLSKFTSLFLAIALPIMIVGVAASLLQTGFMASGEGLKPSLDKINPIKGMKNMFSTRKLIDLIKNILIVSLLAYIGFDFVKNNYEKLIKLGSLYLPSFGVEFKSLLIGIIFRIVLVSIVIAAADYFMQFKMHQKDMKMTKQEIKEESKQAEGDPHIKGKRKQKQRELAMNRMMQAVPDATVVITNPTHISIALKYEKGVKDYVPRVVAKGANNIALKIKEIAKEHKVPIVENRALARLMYETVEIDQDIPVEMYQAVAEILAVIYKLDK